MAGNVVKTVWTFYTKIFAYALGLYLAYISGKPKETLLAH